MKIRCTKSEYEGLHSHLLDLAERPKVWGVCPLGFVYCLKIPVKDIDEDMCRQCYRDNIEWEILENDDSSEEWAENYFKNKDV